MSVSHTIATAPVRIFLQTGDEQHHHDEPFPTDRGHVTWASESCTACEVEYVRADLVTAVFNDLKAAVDALNCASNADEAETATEQIFDCEDQLKNLESKAALEMYEQHEKLLQQRVQLHEALEVAKNGLLWYQSEYSAQVNGCDDEAMQLIDAALESVGGDI